MKESTIIKLGKFLMKKGALRICIVDDEETYFTPTMLKIAEAAGFPNIERADQVTAELFSELHSDPRDIVILDVKGVVDASVAKNGLAVAQSLYRSTPTFIVITSAHQFYLRDLHQDFDYIIDDRLLPAADFVEQLRIIVEKCLNTRKMFYQSLLLRVGIALTKKATLSS